MLSSADARRLAEQEILSRTGWSELQNVAKKASPFRAGVN